MGRCCSPGPCCCFRQPASARHVHCPRLQHQHKDGGRWPRRLDAASARRKAMILPKSCWICDSSSDEKGSSHNSDSQRNVVRFCRGNSVGRHPAYHVRTALRRVGDNVADIRWMGRYSFVPYQLSCSCWMHCPRPPWRNPLPPHHREHLRLGYRMGTKMVRHCLEAAQKRDDVKILTLLKKGIPVDSQDSGYGVTALQLAAGNRHPSTVKSTAWIMALMFT